MEDFRYKVKQRRVLLTENAPPLTPDESALIDAQIRRCVDQAMYRILGIPPALVHPASVIEGHAVAVLPETRRLPAAEETDRGS